MMGLLGDYSGLVDDQTNKRIQTGAMLQTALALLGNRSGRGLAGAADAVAGGLAAGTQAYAGGVQGELQRQSLMEQVQAKKAGQEWSQAYLQASPEGRIQLLEQRATQAYAAGQDKMGEGLMKQAEAMRKRVEDAGFSTALQGISPSQALANGAGPTPENAANIGRVDYQALVARYPGRAEQIKALAESRNYGRDEVARTVEVAGADGRPQTMQFDKFGNPVGQAMNKPVQMSTVDTGGAVRLLDPYTGRFGGGMGKTMTPDGAASNALGWANNAVSRDRLAFDQSQASPVEYKDVGGQLMALPKRPNMTGPIQPIPVAGANKTEQGAKDVMSIIADARPLLKESTGSYIGAGVDAAGRAFGGSTVGGVAAAQLKVLEGALIAKMPRMEGPQSDKDVALYRQAAGALGDPTVPAAEKEAALRTLEGIYRRYSGGSAMPAAVPSKGGVKFLGFE